MSDLVTTALQNWLSSLPHMPQTLVVAYSGGRDSHVLLHALRELCARYPSISLKALHINHGLQADADNWAMHCAVLCQSYAIELKIVSLKLSPKKGESIEALAREARLNVFAQALAINEMLLTAHHQLDQAETALLQLLRGAGPLGLSAMPHTKTLGLGQGVRPLLAVPEQAIAAYAKVHQLEWVEDPSNQHIRFTRNALRHRVFPELKALNPSMAACIVRGATHCAESQSLLAECLKPVLNACLTGNNALDLHALKGHSPLKQQYLLRYWLDMQGILMPSTRQLDTILKQFLTAQRDAQPSIVLQGGTLEWYKQCLYYVRHQFSLPRGSWDLKQSLALADGTTWHALLQTGKGVSASLLPEGKLEIRFRVGGEKCKPSAKMHTRPLKKWLQEYDIPPWQRNNIPLFYYQEKLVAVGSLFVCEGWQVKSPLDQGWVIEQKKQDNQILVW